MGTWRMAYWSLPIGNKKSLLLAVVAVALTLQHATTATAATDAAGNGSIAKPGCRDKCGNLSIPYPFGIGEGCFRGGFEVRCDEDRDAYLSKTEKNLKVLHIDLAQGEVRVQKRINASICGNDTGNTGFPKYVPTWAFNLKRHHFVVSNTKNTFTAIGCATIAVIQGNQTQHNYTSACGSFCSSADSIQSSPQCTGMGCCQTPTPANLRALTISFLRVDGVDYSSVRRFSPCSYAFVAETDWFRFHASYATKSRRFETVYGGGPPVVLEWTIANRTCAQVKKTKTLYECRARNSKCINAPNGLGYRCKCSQGYDGNPYLPGGCRDINECENPSMYPCNGTCSNTVGSYSCSCPSGTHSEDPNSIPCTAPPRAPVGLSIGTGVGSAATYIVLVLIAILSTKRFKQRRARKLRQKIFNINRGQLLKQLVSQKADIAERMIITLDELEKATNNFDKARELGGGGHGTVYKGILSDLQVVAIKKSKIAVQKEINEFINEVAILSQINHKNVVKLYGCCLETEVPLLVYEFISNRTLYHHLHAEGPRSLSWGNRLRIAGEVANALAYLHSSVSIPIIHRDIKSNNILLDDNLTSKISDFGASRYIPIDRTGLTTLVQGTMGYLDPMYFYTGRLNDKSDVYSFGVILVELLTKKKPFSCMTSEGGGLVADFTNLYLAGNLMKILDPQVIEEGGEEVQKVAKLAASCTKLRRKDRPTMRQVNRSLECILSSEKHVEVSILVDDFDESDTMLTDLSSDDEWQWAGDQLRKSNTL